MLVKFHYRVAKFISVSNLSSASSFYGSYKTLTILLLIHNLYFTTENIMLNYTPVSQFQCLSESIAGFDAFTGDKVGRPLSNAIKAGRADNLPPLLKEMSRKQNKISSEITRY